MLLIGVFSLSNTTARAQHPQQTALARKLFEEGVALADRGDWVGAADRFGRAHSLKPTSGTAFNWANALVETGELLLAQELLVGVTRDGRAEPNLKRQSERVLGELRPRIPLLKVRVYEELDPDMEVEIDGATWPRAAWGVSSPIDPGAHLVVLRREDEELSRQELTLAEAESRELVLGAPEVAAAEAPDATEAARSERAPRYKRWLLWSAVGAVVAGGVITAVVLAKRGDGEDAAPLMGNAMPGVIRW